MVFSLRDFVKTGLLLAVGKMADYQIILNSASWLEKGVLTEDDLSEVQTAMYERNAHTENEVMKTEE